ncbi:WD repeat-containing and planar cell polarity effector protein fritz isoform X2 [Aethina tumida]|uniref:WD repeat-containing and planar cell polarity effector protein fritz isoform X2 n=1 Tax=Aethina tumida TaxID=116153 RepID=UPI0021492BA8|nr:WD repeat-containing and planar cell polarity effector protein fritz isoform X2 [Aethina tumida]
MSLISELHFWTTQEDVLVKHTDYGSFKYFHKKEQQESIYGVCKKNYCEQRNVIWQLNNKRPNKLKDRLKDLEEALVNNKIVNYNWSDNKLHLLLSTGLLVNIVVNNSTGDINNIVFDKQLSAKIQANIICDGITINDQVICICNDGHVVGYGGFWKEGWVLEGGPRRKLNYYGEWLAVWGKASSEHPQPWSPLAKDHQRANLHLYWIGAKDPELLAYKKTDGEPLQVVVSKICSQMLIVIEQKVTQKGAVSVEVSNFELVGNNLKRASVTSVPLQTQVSCTALSDCENRLLIGCIDGSLAILNRHRGSTRTVKATFIPTFCIWHPQGALVAISNDRGQLQYFDTALNCVKSQILSEDFSSTPLTDISGYLNGQFNVASLNWGPKYLLFSLEQGPILCITHYENALTFKNLARNYISNNKVDKTIKLLLSWEFNDDSFAILQQVCAHIMRQPMTQENAQHLQNALGFFHNPPIPLSSNVRHHFGTQVFSLTRRFFHQLVRANMFETAFLLAVDLAHHDLFMDLYYIAVKIGETEMAAAARAQASALLSRCSSEASNCSRSSCSQCSHTESSISDEEEYQSNQWAESKKVPDEVPTQKTHNDNYLTTYFNQMNPSTYKPVVQDSNSCAINMEPTKLAYTPKATYVKAPQVPPSFSKAPPNPVVPPLPNLANTLSIPITEVQPVLTSSSRQLPPHHKARACTTNRITFCTAAYPVSLR